MFQGFRLADTLERSALDLFNKRVDALEDLSVRALPIEIIFLGVLGANELHSTSSCSVPPPDSNFDDGISLPAQVFDDRLKAARVEIDGFSVKSSDMLPRLDDPCGQHFLYRDFIACGETQAKTGLPNIPQQVETCNALTRLAAQILDPVVDYFGEIVLTYGFCSRELAKHVPGRIAPALDQHVSHELNTRGQPICKRLGAAVDFIVTDESMFEVAQWIVQHTPFDRLYFYDDKRPLHVSCGPEQKGEVVVMIVSKTGRLVPRVVSAKDFLALSRGTAIDCT